MIFFGWWWHGSPDRWPDFTGLHVNISEMILVKVPPVGGSDVFRHDFYNISGYGLSSGYPIWCWRKEARLMKQTIS